MFWYTTLCNAEHSRVPLGSARNVLLGLARFHTLVLTLWFLVLVGLVLNRFWHYWVTLL